MVENSMFEIVVTGMENQEWQGWVIFSDTESRHPFRSTLELLDIIEKNVPVVRQNGMQEWK